MTGGPRVLSTSACHIELHGKSESTINTLILNSGKRYNNILFVFEYDYRLATGLTLTVTASL